MGHTANGGFTSSNAKAFYPNKNGEACTRPPRN
jgi:hypothetical protein